jgi:hypothetical protein
MRTQAEHCLTSERITYIALACIVPIPILLLYSKLEFYDLIDNTFQEARQLVFVLESRDVANFLVGNKKHLLTYTILEAALVLVGCTSVSPGVPNIFLTSIGHSSGPQIRIGYFGMDSIPRNIAFLQKDVNEWSEESITLLTSFPCSY